jgi:hypothetical protein
VVISLSPRLQTDPEYKDDASNTALAEGKVNWNEALAMVKELASYFNTPELYCNLIPWRFKAANGSGRYESDENEAPVTAQTSSPVCSSPFPAPSRSHIQLTT